MAKQHRKWSEAQKLQIMQEAEQNGLPETLRKYTLSLSLFHRWRRAYNGEGMEGLRPHYKTGDPEVQRLQQENDRLKKIIAKQALEIDFKDELLKKNPWARRRNEARFTSLKQKENITGCSFGVALPIPAFTIMRTRVKEEESPLLIPGF